MYGDLLNTKWSNLCEMMNVDPFVGTSLKKKKKAGNTAEISLPNYKCTIIIILMGYVKLHEWLVLL